MLRTHPQATLAKRLGFLPFDTLIVAHSVPLVKRFLKLFSKFFSSPWGVACPPDIIIVPHLTPNVKHKISGKNLFNLPIDFCSEKCYNGRICGKTGRLDRGRPAQKTKELRYCYLSSKVARCAQHHLQGPRWG